MKSVPPNNVSPSVIELHSRALSWVHQVRASYLKEVDPQCGLARSKKPNRDLEFEKLLGAMEERELFVKKKEGREGFSGFEEMPSNLYLDRNSRDLYTYTKEHIKLFAKYKHLHTDHTVNTDKASLEQETAIDRAFCFEDETQ